MVGIVVVSHSENLARSVVELTSMMAPDAKIVPAGGLEDGSFGTSFERIMNAIEGIHSDEGTIVLVDMGSAIMTTEMVIEAIGADNIRIADTPLVEGAVVATISAVGGTSFEEMLQELSEVAAEKKLG